MNPDALFLESDRDEWRGRALRGLFSDWLGLTAHAYRQIHGEPISVVVRARRDRWEVYVQPLEANESPEPYGRRLLFEVDRQTLEVWAAADLEGAPSHHAGDVVHAERGRDLLEALVAAAPGSDDCAKAVLELERRGYDVAPLVARVATEQHDKLPRVRLAKLRETWGADVEASD